MLSVVGCNSGVDSRYKGSHTEILFLWISVFAAVWNKDDDIVLLTEGLWKR